MKNYTQLIEYQPFCRKRISAKNKKKLNKFLKIMRTPKWPNVRIAWCTFKNQRALAVILETRKAPVEELGSPRSAFWETCFCSSELTTTEKNPLNDALVAFSSIPRLVPSLIWLYKIGWQLLMIVLKKAMDSLNSY